MHFLLSALKAKYIKTKAIRNQKTSENNHKKIRIPKQPKEEKCKNPARTEE